MKAQCMDEGHGAHTEVTHTSVVVTLVGFCEP